jgi:hypothetical protein
VKAVTSQYVRNTPEEEAAIQRGIELDPDTIDLSDEGLLLKPFKFRTDESFTDDSVRDTSVRVV